MNDLAHMMFGAILVWFGVVSGALADRIRGARALGKRRENEASHATVALAKARAVRTSRDAPIVTSAQSAMAADVTLALVTMGYPKATAAEAVAACPSAETSTLESWIRAALKRCTPKEGRV